MVLHPSKLPRMYLQKGKQGQGYLCLNILHFTVVFDCNILCPMSVMKLAQKMLFLMLELKWESNIFSRLKSSARLNCLRNNENSSLPPEIPCRTTKRLSYISDRKIDHLNCSEIEQCRLFLILKWLIIFPLICFRPQEE